MMNMATGFQLLPWQEKMIDEWAVASPRRRREMFPHLGRKNGRSYVMAKIMEHEAECRRVLPLVNKGNGSKTSCVSEEVLWALTQGAE